RRSRRRGPRARRGARPWPHALVRGSPRQPPPDTHCAPAAPDAAGPRVPTLAAAQSSSVAPRRSSTVSTGLQYVSPVPFAPPVSEPANSRPIATPSSRYTSDPESPPRENGPSPVDSTSIWSSKRSAPRPPPYPTTTSSSSIAVTRPAVTPVVRPDLPTASPPSAAAVRVTRPTGYSGSTSGSSSSATAASTVCVTPASNGTSAASVPTRSSGAPPPSAGPGDRKSTRLNSSHVKISYAVFCLKK